MSGAWLDSNLDARLHGCHAQSLGAGRVALKARDLRPLGWGQPALISACAYVDSQGMDEITILQAEVLGSLLRSRAERPITKLATLIRTRRSCRSPI